MRSHETAKLEKNRSNVQLGICKTDISEGNNVMANVGSKGYEKARGFYEHKHSHVNFG